MNIDAIGLELWKACSNKLSITTTTEFLQAFKNLLLEKANVKIDENQENYIRDRIDPGFFGVVSLPEFTIFYDNIWRHLSERNRFFRLKFPSPEEKEKKIYEGDNLQYVLLKIIKRQKDKGPEHFAMPANFEIKVFANFRKTIDKSRKPHKLLNKFSVGSDEINDLILDEKKGFLPPLQFALFFARENVFIKDYAKTSHTVLRVTTQPISLALDLIIRIGLNTLLVVTAVSPLSRRTPKDDSFIAFTPEEEEPEEIYQNTKIISKGERLLDVSSFREKKRIMAEESLRYQELDSKELLLECIEGEEKDRKESYLLKFVEKDDFTIGRSEIHDVPLNDITVSLNHCMIGYDKGTGWFIKEDAAKPSYFGTYVYFVNHKQYERSSESYPQILPHQGMLTFANYDVYFKKERKQKAETKYTFAKK